jgi:hypothetical protein
MLCTGAQELVEACMQLNQKAKTWLAAGAVVASTGLIVFMLGGSGKIGPPYRNDFLVDGPEPLMLLNQPSVQKDLGLTASQIRLLEGMIQQQFTWRRPAQGSKTDKNSPPARRSARMGRKHQEVALARVLKPQQIQRLHQITLQQLGGLALGNKKTADDLQLTEAQRQKVDAVLESLTGGMGQNFRPGRRPQDQQQMQELRQKMQEARQKMQETRQKAGDELLALLTSEQESRWHELIGPPFTGEITFRPRGQWPGGRGGGWRRQGQNVATPANKSNPPAP